MDAIQPESSRKVSEYEVAELAGVHHPYRFEPEDTYSDHSEFSNEENECITKL